MKIETWANILLFTSSLILLINIAPVDFQPGHRKLIKSIDLLKTQKIIYGDFPSNVKIEFGTEPYIIDPKSFSALKNFVKTKSPKSKEINWGKAIGIAYSTTSLNTADGLTMASAQSLKLVLLPTNNEKELQVITIGSINDLNTWISEPRQNSLNFLALLFLTIGFFLQMLPGLIEFIKQKFF